MKRELTIAEKDMLIKGLTMIKNEKEAMLKNNSKTNVAIGGAIGSAVASIGSTLGSSTPTVVSAGLTGMAGTSVLPVLAAVGGAAFIGGFLFGRKMGKKECLVKTEQIEQLMEEIKKLKKYVKDEKISGDSYTLRYELEVVYDLSKALNIDMNVLIVSSDLPEGLSQLKYVKNLTEMELQNKLKQLSDQYKPNKQEYKNALTRAFACVCCWLNDDRYYNKSYQTLFYNELADKLSEMRDSIAKGE